MVRSNFLILNLFVAEALEGSVSIFVVMFYSPANEVFCQSQNLIHLWRRHHNWHLSREGLDFGAPHLDKSVLLGLIAQVAARSVRRRLAINSALKNLLSPRHRVFKFSVSSRSMLAECRVSVVNISD